MSFLSDLGGLYSEFENTIDTLKQEVSSTLTEAVTQSNEISTEATDTVGQAVESTNETAQNIKDSLSK